jgi:hypothetical protein
MNGRTARKSCENMFPGSLQRARQMQTRSLGPASKARMIRESPVPVGSTSRREMVCRHGSWRRLEQFVCKVCEACCLPHHCTGSEFDIPFAARIYTEDIGPATRFDASPALPLCRFGIGSQGNRFLGQYLRDKPVSVVPSSTVRRLPQRIARVELSHVTQTKQTT